jgi:hypothetical protein
MIVLHIETYHCGRSLSQVQEKKILSSHVTTNSPSQTSTGFFFRCKGLAIFFMCSSIIAQILGVFLKRKGLLILFDCSSFIFQNLGFLLGREGPQCFWCAAASFAKIWAVSSGERDSWYYWCAAASFPKICAFFLQGKDLDIIGLCSSICLHIFSK